MLSAILLSTGSVFLLGRAVFGKKKRGKSTTMEKREQLGSRLGFIMISAGCAIGCGNVWKFPWMCGQNGGGGFMLIYLICLLILGLPVMTMEFSVGALPGQVRSTCTRSSKSQATNGGFSVSSV